MAFDKKAYWENKPNNIGSKRPKPIVTPSSDVEVILKGGKFVTLNRETRRSKPTTNIYKRKGFIEHLDAIRIKRLKHGKVSYKYVKLNRSGVL
jgi:hypothetical protein